MMNAHCDGGIHHSKTTKRQHTLGTMPPALLVTDGRLSHAVLPPGVDV